eukprot:Opistho-2@54677
MMGRSAKTHKRAKTAQKETSGDGAAHDTDSAHGGDVHVHAQGAGVAKTKRADKKNGGKDSASKKNTCASPRTRKKEVTGGVRACVCVFCVLYRRSPDWHAMRACGICPWFHTTDNPK